MFHQKKGGKENKKKKKEKFGKFLPARPHPSASRFPSLPAPAAPAPTRQHRRPCRLLCHRPALSADALSPARSLSLFLSLALFLVLYLLHRAAIAVPSSGSPSLQPTSHRTESTNGTLRSPERLPSAGFLLRSPYAANRRKGARHGRRVSSRCPTKFSVPGEPPHHLLAP